MNDEWFGDDDTSENDTDKNESLIRIGNIIKSKRDKTSALELNQLDNNSRNDEDEKLKLVYCAFFKNY